MRPPLAVSPKPVSTNVSLADARTYDHCFFICLCLRSGQSLVSLVGGSSMGTAKSQRRKRFSWALAFLVSGLLYTPMTAMVQTTEATEPAVDEDEQAPVCEA